jgi:hypothetical protein
MKDPKRVGEKRRWINPDRLFTIREKPEDGKEMPRRGYPCAR